jgi:hypothetical protein
MSHHQLSHPMNINTEKIWNNTLDVIDIITKYYFNYNWKHFKAAMDALVHFQDTYAEAKYRADAELQIMQGTYYNN